MKLSKTICRVLSLVLLAAFAAVAVGSRSGWMWAATWLLFTFFAAAAIGPEARSLSIAKRIIGTMFISICTLAAIRLSQGWHNDHAMMTLVFFISALFLVVDQSVSWIRKTEPNQALQHNDHGRHGSCSEQHAPRQP